MDLAPQESIKLDDKMQIDELRAQIRLRDEMILELKQQKYYLNLVNEKYQTSFEQVNPPLLMSTPESASQDFGTTVGDPSYVKELETYLEERNQRTRELSSLIDIIRSTSSKLDINETLTITAQHFTQALGVVACNILKWNSERDTVSFWARWWIAQPHELQPPGEVLAVGARPALRDVFKNHQFMVVWADDPQADPQETSGMARYGASSLLVFPFASNEKILGIIELYDTKAHRKFAETEIHYCQTIADHLGVLFERTQLHSEIRQRADQLALLNRLSAQITGLIVMKDLCNFVTQNLHEQFGYYSVSVFFVEWQTEKVILQSVAGRAPRHPSPGTAFALGDGLVGLAIAKAEIIQADNLQDFPAHDDAQNSEVQSELIIPLLLRDTVIGVLVIDEDETFAFANTNVTLLMTLADQLALALDKARLFEENQARNLELESIIRENQALETISQALNESLDLNEVFGLIEKAVYQIIPHISQVAVHILDQDQNVLIPMLQGDVKLSMPLGEGIAGLAGLQKKLLNVPDVQKHPHFISSTNQDIYALLVAPILRKGDLVGTISISSNKNAAFSPRDENVISRLATITALAIQNARVYQDEQEERQFAEALLSATMVLNSSLDLNDILDHILEQINLVVPNRSANIMLVKGDSAYIARHIEAGLNVAATDAIRVSLDWPTINTMKANHRPVFIPDTQKFPEWQVIEGREWVRTYIGVPMFFQNELIGFLNVVSDKPYIFSHKAPRRLEALAASAALAIRNAQLLADLAESLEKEQQTRAHLVQADKLTALGRMVASIAHEINNPIQTIKNTFYLALDEVESTSQVAHFIEIAMSETNRIANLIAQLRDTYRPRAHATTQRVDITRLLNDIKILMTPHLEQNHIVWQGTEETRAFIVPGFPDRLKQVFINLSLNAIEAMHRESQDGTLTVRLHDDVKGRRVGVQFQDTGPGMSPEILKNIFEPFFTTKETGTGLGLAISYDIVQQHQGQILVESVPEQGTSFMVWLPYLAINDPLS